MFHFFHGTLEPHAGMLLLRNDFVGIQISYAGNQKSGNFFLYPYLDEKKKTIFYFAFDTAEQKQLFEALLKISGI
jgi:Holliday junction resolvasome RuvABC DNA-binding subunit